MEQKQNVKGQQVAIAGLTQLRQNERLLTSAKGDKNRRRHSGNNSEFGKVALADRAESISLCQSLVAWFSSDEECSD